MNAVLILLITFFFGNSLLRLTKVKLNKPESYNLSFVIGLVIFTWINLVFIYFLGYQLGITVSIIIASLFSFSIKKQSAISTSSQLLNYSITSYLNYSIFWFLILSFLFFTHMFQVKPDGWYSGGGAWGDLALHATQINYFANQNQFSLNNPIFNGQESSYPFLINFYTSLLVRTGASLQWALILTGLTLSFITTQLLYLLVVKVSKSSLAAWIASLIFFFNGGLGFYYFFIDWLQSKHAFWQYIFQLQVEYAHLAKFNLHWSNIVADYLLPQRGFVIGLAIFLSVISLWHNNFSQLNNRTLWLTSLLIGLTPLLHTHTYLTLVGLYVWLMIYWLLKKQISFKFFILNSSFLILLSLPQFFWQTNHTSLSHFSQLKYGWMKPEQMILVWFWLINMGLSFIFLSLGNLFFLLKIKKQTFLKTILIPVILLFILCNLVTFQPHVYDNMKFMLYSYLVTSMVAGILLTKFWQINKINKFLVILALTLLTFTGVLSVWRESYTSWKIVDNSQLKVAKFISEQTSTNSLWLTSDDHNHLVPMLAGRSIIMGYRGWLWTHGIDYSQREKDVSKMYQGGVEAKNLLQKYGVNYIYLGSSEVTKFQANQAWYEKNFPTIYQDEMIRIFEIN